MRRAWEEEGNQTIVLIIYYRQAQPFVSGVPAIGGSTAITKRAACGAPQMRGSAEKTAQEP